MPMYLVRTSDEARCKQIGDRGSTPTCVALDKRDEH
jgi:hypothetical protein